MKNIKYKMQITTCSPVFIGSGEEISSGEFLKDSNYIYIPYKKDLSQIVTSDDALFANYKDVLRKIALEKSNNQQKSNQLNLASVFCKHPALREKLKKTSKQIFISSDLKQKNDDLANPIKLFMSNSNGFYIPGSSIKGAFRTYILKSLIENQKYSINEYSKGKQIENSLLRTGEEKTSDDFLRAWQFADSEIIENKNFEIYKIDKLGSSKSLLPIYIVGLKQNTKIEFTFTYDTYTARILRSNVPPIDELLNQLNQVDSQEIKQLKTQHSTMKNLIPQNESINFSLGGHIGKLRHTLFTGKIPKTISTVNGVSVGWCHLQILNKEEF